MDSKPIETFQADNISKDLACICDSVLVGFDGRLNSPLDIHQGCVSNFSRFVTVYRSLFDFSLFYFLDLAYRSTIPTKKKF